jgi:hypothetical protein
MNPFSLLRRQRFEVPCTVEIEHSGKSLHAHVELEGDFVIEPGDEVVVRDAPTDAPFGSKIMVRRIAVVTRASATERAWTRWAGNLELASLYDVSFTNRRSL